MIHSCNNGCSTFVIPVDKQNGCCRYASLLPARDESDDGTEEGMREEEDGQSLGFSTAMN